MEEKKYVKISLTSIILLLIIVILLGIIAVGGIYIFTKQNEEVSAVNNEQVAEKEEITQIEPKITKDENGNVKSIIADLNNDGKAETAEFYYTYKDLGTEPEEKFISKFYTNLIEENNEKDYTKDFNEDMYIDLSVELVDIDKNDNYKEIKISYMPTDASAQYYFNYFLKYDGYDYDFIKVNRSNNEYLMYEEEKDADDYIISGIGDNGNKLKIENGKVKAYSFIDQEETYNLKENGQLILTESKFAGTKEMYTQFFMDWGPGAVYDQKDLNSNSYVYGSANEEGSDYIIPTEIFEVLKVEDHWLEVNVNNDVGYISYQNVYNEPGT